MDLNGKVAIVTGASRGIGRQIALALARRGAAVALAARTVEPHRRLPGTIGETQAAVEAAGGRAIAVQVDQGRPEDLERLVAETLKAFGRIDILVCNAAMTSAASAPIESYPRDNWLQQFDVNLHGPFTLMGLVVPHMKDQGGGVIVNMTSGAGDLRPVDLQARGEDRIKLGALLGYAASKAALSRLTNAVAPELAAAGITSVAIDPGFTRTELVEALGEKGLVRAEDAHSMQLPVDLVLEVVTSERPLAYAGQILRVEAPAKV